MPAELSSPPTPVQRGPLLVLSGPSGVGKTTVVTQLLARTKLPLRRAITATTRPPRPGETPEADYHFWTREQFESAIQQGAMLEHAIVFGRDYYGTPLAEVEPHRERGYGVLLVIDVQGASQVRRKYPNDHHSIFIRPPSVEDLRQRLQARGSEDPARLAVRLATAEAELAQAEGFHHQLVNQELDQAVRDLEALIARTFPVPLGGTADAGRT